ncbi:MAG: sulfatase [Verrucomicrobiota bacterium]
MKKRPNIMLLQGEDVGRHLGSYGDDYAHTPNLDQLAKEGARFTHAISHAPVCAPSRGGMVSGCYPWSIGSHHMRSNLLNPPRCFTHELRDAGYHVSWPTKLDFNFEPLDGWCDDQEKWWERPAPQQPFFVYENFWQTHESQMFQEGIDRIREMDVPQRHDPKKASVPPLYTDSPEIRDQLASYYDAVGEMDRMIGQRLKWLDEQGLRDNTIVLFLTDHGRGLPREKRWVYGEGVHLPLIVHWPGNVEGGGEIDDLVAWVDIAPTLVSIAGGTIPSHYQGQIFLGAEKAPPRKWAFFGRDRMDENFDKIRGARSNEGWHYIRNDVPGLPWARRQNYMEQQPGLNQMRECYEKGELDPAQALFFGETKPREELYDAYNDPWMLNNLAELPEHQSRLTALRQAVADHLAQVGDLGEIDEKELVRRGIVDDQFETYREWIQMLPAGQHIGPRQAPLTLEEADSFLSKM